MGVTTNIPEILDKLSDYSVTSAVSTLNPAELGGSTGSIDFTSCIVKDVQFLRNREFTLTDSRMGSVFGRISQIIYDTKDQDGPRISAETRLQKLNTTVTIPPKYLASEQTCMNSVLSVAGFTSEGLSATPATDIFPGWYGTILDYLKHFCSARGKEYFVKPGNPNVLVFRSIRTRLAEGHRASESFTLNDQTLAKSIETNWYNYITPATLLTNLEFTPNYSADEPQILTVSPGERTEYDIKLNAWVSEVNQPVVMDYVGPDARTDLGAYSVAGTDGLPVRASQWKAFGGSLEVSLTDDPSVLHVAITGPSSSPLIGTDGADRFGPYSIAATAVQDNQFYNSLHITGKGVAFEQNLVTLSTGAVSQVTIEEVGATIDNPFVSSLSKAYDVGMVAAQIYAGPTHRVDMSFIPKTNVVNDILGGRYITDNGNMFRVESLTFAYDGITASGAADTTIVDSGGAWAGKTLAQYDANWTGKTLTDQAAAPLWKA